jgi:hypothetical protein
LPLRAGAAFKRYGKARIFLEPRQVHGDDWDVLEAGLDERLAQQMDIVGGAAAAARLRDEKAELMLVVVAAVHRLDELADD